MSRGDRTLSGPRERRFQPAYGVLAAAAAGAVVVLIIGVATLGFLHTASNQAAAGEHQRSTPSQSIATPPTSGASASAPAKSGTTTNPTASTPSTTQPRQPQPEPTTAASADTAAWTRTLQSLDAQRAKAFWTLDVDALDNIYVPGSNAWQADRALLTTYRKQQIRVQGLRINIESTTVTNRTPTTVTLKTTDHLTAGQAVDHTGTRTPFPPGEPTTRLITLTTSTPRATSTPAWRIATITRA